MITIITVLLAASGGSAQEHALGGTPSQVAKVRFEPRHVRGFRSHCGGGFNYWSDVVPWLGECEQRIRRSGFDEKRFHGLRVKIEIAVAEPVGPYDKTGADGILSVVRSSGSKALDQRALDLLRKASPFDVPRIGIPANRPLILDLDYPRLEPSYVLKNDPDRPRWLTDPFSPPGTTSSDFYPQKWLKK